MNSSDRSFQVRLRSDLRSWLEENAAANHRTIKAQLELILEEAKRLDENRNAPDWRQPEGSTFANQTIEIPWKSREEALEILCSNLTRAREQEDKSKGEITE